MSPDARDLIERLCTVDVSKRLGNIKGGAQTVKNHKWFQHINWDDLYQRRTPGPIIPKLTHAADTTNFDEYDPEPKSRAPYTDELRNKYESEFEDF
jgi:serine/threonine protein kinase